MDIMINSEIGDALKINSCFIKQDNLFPVKLISFSEIYFICIIEKEIINTIKLNQNGQLIFRIENEKHYIPIYLESIIETDGLYLLKICFHFSDLPLQTKQYLKEIFMIKDIVQRRKEDRIKITKDICNLIGLNPDIKIKSSNIEICSLRDISFSGVRCVTPTIFYKGEKIILHFEFTSPHIIIPIFAIITRQSSVTIANHSFYDLGIQFLESSINYQKRIQQCFN